jgi:Tfp pilus assembly protein FimV
MRPETLAETLRHWMEARIKARSAYEALIEMDADAEYFTDETARAYLRGHDDAKAEAAHTEMLLREAQDEIANAKARVRELEAQIAAQPAQALGEEG